MVGGAVLATRAAMRARQIVSQPGEQPSEVAANRGEDRFGDVAVMAFEEVSADAVLGLRGR